MKTISLIALLITSVQPAQALSLSMMKKAKSPAAKIRAKAPDCKRVDLSARFRIEFQEAELGSYVQAIGRALCRNMVVDPKYRQKLVSVSLAQKVSGAELWSVFLSTLAAHRMTLAQRGPLLVVIPASEATRASVPLYGPKDQIPDEERMVTKVLRVKKDANKLTNYLNLFKSPQGQLHPYSSENIIVITDFASSIKRMLRLAEFAKHRPSGR